MLVLLILSLHHLDLNSATILPWLGVLIMSNKLKNGFFYTSSLLSIIVFFVVGCNQTQENIVNIETTPDTNRFRLEVLATGVIDPTEMAIDAKGNAFVLERKGGINYYNAANKSFQKVRALKVNLGHEDGLLGIALDPKYALTHWVYILYTPDPHREQRISRFVFKNNQIDLQSEKVIISYPIVPERHQGGSLAFDGAGNLYISTGENTKPTDINGHAPIDERIGHEINDSQRSAGNTNDMRGKILRIHPNPDGSYSIPKGNLFEANMANTRPEIYVMGCRNPFRITIDKPTATLYWGDIGPDAGEDTEKGPKGYDEINRTQKAGNFGWPYFIANNKAYAKVDYTTGQVLEKYNSTQPVNASPNNTGLHQLPSAQPAWIWYPYNASTEFPIMGSGGRTAIAGGVYHYNAKNKEGFPSFYNNQLFVGDWMRNHIKSISQNKNGVIEKIYSFLPNQKFIRPIDMQFGNDGCLYVLEYGSNWFDNTDARLIKVSYLRSNMAPVAKLKASGSAGALPFKVSFSSAGSFDVDHDSLIYEWRFDNGNLIQSRVHNPSYVFTKPGTYVVSLTVTDTKGNIGSAQTKVLVGNTPPTVDIDLIDRGSFYWPGELINYTVSASDKEDGILANQQVVVKMLPFYNDATTPQPYGDKLIQESDCKSCHQADAKSVGPSFTQIANRYAGNNDEVITKLGNKIVQGGSGVWSSYVMSAHPQLGIEEAKEMVKHIFSYASANTKSNMEMQGNFAIPMGKLNPKMSYGLAVVAADKGFQRQPILKTEKIAFLRPPVLEAKNYDWCKDIINSGPYARMPFPTSGIAFYNLDLKNVGSLTLEYGYDFFTPHCFVECRLDAPNGKLIGRIEIQKKINDNNDMLLTMPITANSGNHKIYINYHPDLTIHSPLNLKSIYLNR